jgi:ABC-2 type transport system permease protein
MTALALNSWDMTRRWVLALWRQPWYVAVTLFQPVVWLLLFGALFKNVVEIPGFQGTSYKDFLAPGVVIMSAVFSAGWNGMGMIEDLDRGVMDRLLVSPVSRAPLIIGPLTQAAIVITIQSVIIVGLALAIGASFPGGVPGVIALIVCAVLLGAATAAVSNAIALTARQEETLIGATNFLILPLTFLSGCFMQLSLAPEWIQTVGDYNPVNWAVAAGREAVSASVDWGFVLARVGLLAALAVACVLLATRAFRSYQRSA